MWQLITCLFRCSPWHKEPIPVYYFDNFVYALKRSARTHANIQMVLQTETHTNSYCWHSESVWWTQLDKPTIMHNRARYTPNTPQRRSGKMGATCIRPTSTHTCLQSPLWVKKINHQSTNPFPSSQSHRYKLVSCVTWNTLWLGLSWLGSSTSCRGRK